MLARCLPLDPFVAELCAWRDASFIFSQSQVTQPLAFELVLDPAETVRAGQVIARRARNIKNQTVGLLLVVVPFALIMWLEPPAAVAFGFVALMGLVSLIPLIWPRWRRFQIRRFYASAPALHGPQRYEFTNDGLAVSNASVRNLIQWAAFVEAAETAEFFLLYYATNCAYYLPRRVMESEEQVNAVRRLLREHLGDRAIHVAPPA